MMMLTDVPLFPLNTVLFPGMSLPLNIFEERYKVMIARCIEEQIEFGVVLIREGEQVGDDKVVPYEVGTLARIAQSQREPGGGYQLRAAGTRRFRIHSLSHQHPYLSGDVETFELAASEDAPQRLAIRDIADTVATLFAEYFRLTLSIAGQWQETLGLPDEPRRLADWVASRIVAPAGLKQRMLEAPGLEACLQLQLAILSEAIPMLTERVRMQQAQRWRSMTTLN